jgi:hypothetical protein
MLASDWPITLGLHSLLHRQTVPTFDTFPISQWKVYINIVTVIFFTLKRNCGDIDLVDITPSVLVTLSRMAATKYITS